VNRTQNGGCHRRRTGRILRNDVHEFGSLRVDVGQRQVTQNGKPVCLTQLEAAVLQQIEQFFTNYQRVRNIEFEVIERGGPQAALELLREAAEDPA
jgi:DNA-binding response OmpR family regulator